MKNQHNTEGVDQEQQLNLDVLEVAGLKILQTQFDMSRGKEKKGSVTVDANMNPKILRAFLDAIERQGKYRVSLNMTRATEEQRNAIVVVPGALQDASNNEAHYPNLKVVRGQFFIGRTKEPHLPLLKEVEGGVNAPGVEILFMPSVEKIGREPHGASIYLPEGRVLRAPRVKQLSGGIGHQASGTGDIGPTCHTVELDALEIAGEMVNGEYSPANLDLVNAKAKTPAIKKVGAMRITGVLGPKVELPLEEALSLTLGSPLVDEEMGEEKPAILSLPHARRINYLNMGSAWKLELGNDVDENGDPAPLVISVLDIRQLMWSAQTRLEGGRDRVATFLAQIEQLKKEGKLVVGMILQGSGIAENIDPDELTSLVEAGLQKRKQILAARHAGVQAEDQAA